ncbi:MAG: LysM peptidoglycan-binding domain-containing protein, partial [Rhodobacterales bacterium]|nr:LysM peptidoglycan-binding domain-containing protein [Rhodobacterales bacterium]
MKQLKKLCHQVKRLLTKNPLKKEYWLRGLVKIALLLTISLTLLLSNIGYTMPSYTVKKGDTLSKIAREQGYSLSDFKLANQGI